MIDYRIAALTASLALAACHLPPLVTESVPDGQPWFCEDYEAEGEKPPVDCIRESRGE